MAGGMVPAARLGWSQAGPFILQASVGKSWMKAGLVGLWQQDEGCQVQGVMWRRSTRTESPAVETQRAMADGLVGRPPGRRQPGFTVYADEA
jgi:hypothetical protein